MLHFGLVDGRVNTWDHSRSIGHVQKWYICHDKIAKPPNSRIRRFHSHDKIAKPPNSRNRRCVTPIPRNRRFNAETAKFRDFGSRNRGFGVLNFGPIQKRRFRGFGVPASQNVTLNMIFTCDFFHKKWIFDRRFGFLAHLTGSKVCLFSEMGP